MTMIATYTHFVIDQSYGRHDSALSARATVTLPAPPWMEKAPTRNIKVVLRADRSTKPKQIQIGKTTYPSIRAAEEATGISRERLRYAIKKGRLRALLKAEGLL